MAIHHALDGARNCTDLDDSHGASSTSTKLEFESIDITQVTISKSRKTRTGTMMLARNPVTIISATKI